MAAEQRDDSWTRWLHEPWRDQVRGIDPTAVTATDEAAPVVAFLRVVSGDLAGGLRLAHQVLVQDEPGPALSDRDADVLVLRLWTALLEGRDVAPACEAARSTLARPGGIDPARRALLELNLAAALQETLSDVDEASILAVEDHLASARHLATLLGYPGVATAALSRLAQLAVLRGDVPSALRCVESARDERRATGASGSASSAFRLAVAEQWARHCTNVSMDSEQIEKLSDWARGRGSRQAALAASLRALAMIDEGDVSGTRRFLNRTLADPQLRAAGPWSIMLVLLDGYLAVVSRDERRLAAAAAGLRRLHAEGEARLLEATELAHVGDHDGAIDRLVPVTSSRIPAVTITFPSACALEAVLHRRRGDLAAARLLLGRAIADTQRTGVLRPFTIHDPSAMREIINGLAPTNAATDAWTRVVAAAVAAGFASQATRTTAVPLPSTAEAGSPVSPLTVRETEILGLLAEGWDRQRLARELHLSSSTIKTHLRSIRRKVGVASLVDAVGAARASGWLE